MSNYRAIQLVNSSVGAVAINGYVPFGKVVHSLYNKNSCDATFTVGTTGANIITLNEAGKYNITFGGSFVAAAAGVISVSLILDGVPVYTASATATAGGTVNITLPTQQALVLQNCKCNVTNNPVDVQIQISGVTAITGGVCSLLVERVY